MIKRWYNRLWGRIYGGLDMAFHHGVWQLRHVRLYTEPPTLEYWKKPDGTLVVEGRVRFRWIEDEEAQSE